MKIRNTFLFMCIATSSCSSYKSEHPRHEREEDAIWIDKAVKIHFGSDKDARDEALATTDTVVIFLKREVCVSFRLKENTLGGDYAVCFNRDDGTISQQHTEGE